MKTDRVNSGGKEVLLGHVNELSRPAQSCSEPCLCDACATWVSQGSYLCSITGPQVTACILPTTATKKKKSLCILGSCRPFRLFCIYGTWKKCSLFLPWAPYFPHCSLWTCYPAAPYHFFHTIPNLNTCATRRFSPLTLFSKYSIIFVIFWDISHFQSILQKAVPGWFKTEWFKSNLVVQDMHFYCIAQSF